MLLLILCACVIAARNIHLGSRSALNALAVALAAHALSQSGPALTSWMSTATLAAADAVSVQRLSLSALYQPLQPLLAILPSLALLASGLFLVDAIRRLRGEHGASLIIAAALGFAAVLALTILGTQTVRIISTSLAVGAFLIAAMLCWQRGAADSSRIRISLSLTLTAAALVGLVQLPAVSDWLSHGLAATTAALPMLQQNADLLASVLLALTAPQLLALVIERQSNETGHDKQVDRISGAASRSFLLAGAQTWIAAQQREQVSTGLLMIAIDQYRQIAMRYGRTVGDAVLRHTVNALRESLLDDSVIARYAGAQFCVLVPVSDEHDAHRIAQRLRRAIELAPFCDGAITHSLTISIGLAMHRAGYALSDALSTADRRLYQASRTGDNRLIGNEQLLDSAVV